MVLGGLWHGASWSFVLWGALHGAYLVVNHAFRAFVKRIGIADRLDRSRVFVVLAWSLTFLSVVVAWVFFRAETLAGALRMLDGMSGRVPSEVDAGLLLWNAGLQARTAWVWCGWMCVMTLALPNSNVVGAWLMDWLQRHCAWQPLLGGAAFAVAVGLVVLNTARESVSAFIYFNF
jgi:alginate O-acetyltransferase complex protein AlgI